MALSLTLHILLFSLTFIPTSLANYQFTVRFYEFRNPLGLQCGACGSGGPPACCDDVNRNESCNTTRPFACDTRFRFLLRSFEESVEIAPNVGFPHFTPSNFGNSHTFFEGPGGFLALPNPFTVNSTDEWTGRIQFFIDALDRPVPVSGLSEVEAIINRFPIDLELELGSNFTARASYTGFYNISGLEFDMSFRVQCSEKYYGPNCVTFCEPMKGVYNCDSQGRIICIQSGQDPTTNCTQCLTGRDINTNCTTCLQGYDPSTNCTQCVTGRDIATDCTACLPGYVLSTNCMECFPDIVQCQSTLTTLTTITTSTDFSETISGSCSTDPVVTLAILGGVLGLSVVINVILFVVVVTLVIRKSNTFGSSLPPTSATEGEGERGTMDIEMKPNSRYDLTSGSESIVCKPNEVYGVSVPAEPSHGPATYEYVTP